MLTVLLLALAAPPLALPKSDPRSAATSPPGYEVLHAFEPSPLNAPVAPLLRHSNGSFYGTLSRGGPKDMGGIYRYSGGVVQILHAFDGVDGGGPTPLVEGPDGALYGTGWAIFRIDVTTGTFSALRYFLPAEGVPNGGLTLASDGWFYGTTAMGFRTAVYRYQRDSGTFELFPAVAFGGSPAVGLIEATDGMLYGVSGCGNGSGGSLFRHDPATSLTVILHQFTIATGDFPCAPLIQGVDGLLYGTTTSGGAHSRGVLFRFDPGTLVYTVLHSFTAAGDDAIGLYQAADGSLHGTTISGGTWLAGTIFRYDLATGTLTFRHHFGSASGYRPRSALVDGGDGLLLGTTDGGMSEAGTIYSYDPAATGSRVVIRHRFQNAGGSEPQADLLVGGDGALYGTTARGGSGGGGTLFRYHPMARRFTTLHAFDGTHGARPLATPVAGLDAALYGTTSLGGAYNTGTLYRFDPATERLEAFHHFVQFSWSIGPVAPLAMGPDGALYGTTHSCGQSGQGTVFRFHPLGTGVTTIVAFDRDGYPSAGLTLASDGFLYGTTTGGPSFTGDAIIYRVNPMTAAMSVRQRLSSLFIPSAAAREAGGALFIPADRSGPAADILRYDPVLNSSSIAFHFSGPDGDAPMSSFVVDARGWFFATTERGGSSDLGTVYRFDPVTFEHQVVHSFSGADGAHPRGGVVSGPDGALYGTTSSGGPLGGGVLYRITGVQ